MFEDTDTRDRPDLEYMSKAIAVLVRSVAYWKMEAHDARERHGHTVARSNIEVNGLQDEMARYRTALQGIAAGKGKWASVAREAVENG